MGNFTVLGNLRRICRERGVPISSVEHALRERSGYPIDKIDIYAEEADLRFIAQYLGVPLSRLVMGVEAETGLYTRAVFEDAFEHLRSEGRTKVSREWAWSRIKEGIEGHRLTDRGLHEHMRLLIDGLAAPLPGAREACDHLNCDCVGLCKVTGRRMDAAG